MPQHAQLRLGLIREGKTPPDKRVALTPSQAVELQQRLPHVQVICQESPIRCYTDEEYTNAGIKVSAEITDCDILMGIKEVPISQLLPQRTYLFFSHTLKKQPYNQRLLRAILDKNISLIDYEALKDKQGNRLVAFGRYAGIVGAYNALWMYGRRYHRYSLRRAHECFDVNDLKLELRKAILPPVKIALTGTGRVARGAMETLDTAGIRKVNPTDFIQRTFSEPVYVQLSSEDYHLHHNGADFNRSEFHQYPNRYHSSFLPFAAKSDVLLAGAFWNPAAPKLFSLHDMQSASFRIKIIADITCDINGSIPSTIRASTIPQPVYDFDPWQQMEALPFSDDKHITVMAVDNLPCELPRSSSAEFGRDLLDRILKPLLVKDAEGTIQRATLTHMGKMSAPFQYLQDYANGVSVP